MFTTSIYTFTLAGFVTAAAFAAAPVAAGQSEIRDHRSTVTVRDHRTPAKNEVVIVGQGDQKCRAGTVKLFKMGYSNIRAYDCEGAVFEYAATDGYALFRASMSSHSGAMHVEFVGLLGE